MTRCIRLPKPRAASQIANPATIAKTMSTMAATSADRPLRKSEMASSGPNSPTAPRAITPMPNGVPRSPESRSTGMIVPSAVDVRAMPMKAAAAGSGAKMIAIPTPATSDITHPIAARLNGRPRMALKSISLPARKNSIARPKSARSAVKSSGSIQPSTAGPSSSPRTISKTTSGMANQRPTARTSNGAATAMAGNSTMVPIDRSIGASLRGRCPHSRS